MELSLCMIVRNEEENLGRCLDSVVDAVDEIVIVDTGSTDATMEIAGRYTDRVYEAPWEDDFAGARNISLGYARKPFILWLDADDVMDPLEKEKLIALKERLSLDVDAVMMPYHYAFSGDGRPSLIFERERIVRRDAGFRFEGAVHEAMNVSGRIMHEDIVVRHTGRHGAASGKRNLAIFERRIAGGKALSPRDWYYYARELHAAGAYARAADAFNTFLLQPGFIENRIDAHILLAQCFVALGRRLEGRESLLKSLGIAPRARALCALGALCMEEEKWTDAALWYRAAMLCEEDMSGGGFIEPDAGGYIPLMQLCVIYDRLGRLQEAAQMNERALRIHPQDSAALGNRAYFERKMGRTTEEWMPKTDGQEG